jgi:hypothetical protein
MRKKNETSSAKEGTIDMKKDKLDTNEQQNAKDLHE